MLSLLCQSEAAVDKQGIKEARSSALFLHGVQVEHRAIEVKVVVWVSSETKDAGTMQPASARRPTAVLTEDPVASEAYVIPPKTESFSRRAGVRVEDLKAVVIFGGIVREWLATAL